MAYRRPVIFVLILLIAWHESHLRSSVLAARHMRVDQHYKYELNNHGRSSSLDIKEKIIEWQCRAKCSHQRGFSNFDSCKSKCKVDMLEEPRAGQCPQIFLPAALVSQDHGFAPQKLDCLEQCTLDFDCPEVQKCCESSCGGKTCVTALGLKDNKLLPPIPSILHLRLPRGHKVEVTIQTSANSTIYYHVETRYHIGQLFSPRKLGSWQWQPVEMTAEEILENRKKRIQICFNLKPGRWYQVRIAAINAFGFRGYSEPSKAFTLSKNPRPPLAPTELQVIAANQNDKHYDVTIFWCPSKSNLPIEKYRIFWSLYVKSKEESIVSEEAFVKDSNQIQITGLLPESSYYIQVLAVSISGRRRLKSEKASILFNTTAAITPSGKFPKCYQALENEAFSFNHKLTQATKHHFSKSGSTSAKANATQVSYDVRFRLNHKYGMIAQISGLQSNKEQVYELCTADSNCEAHHDYNAIRAKKNSLEFSRLKYNTSYFLKAIHPVTLSEPNNGREIVNSRVYVKFITPKCENFRKRFPKMHIQC